MTTPQCRNGAWSNVVTGAEQLARSDFAAAIVKALNGMRKATSLPQLDGALVRPTPTSNAGQTAKRPLASGLKLDKLARALPDWRPRPVAECLAHWVAHPRGKPLGD